MEGLLEGNIFLNFCEIIFITKNRNSYHIDFRQTKYYTIIHIFNYAAIFSNKLKKEEKRRL